MRRSALSIASLLVACSPQPPASSVRVPEGCVVLEPEPDPAVVTDPDLRARIGASEWPWRVRHESSGIELLLVPPGEYARGASPGDEEALSDEHPRHLVRIRAPFYLGRTEVTQGEWLTVMGEEPSHFAGDPLRPVEQVNYVEVRAFLERAALDLPTEGQWEYACRAGSTASRPAELDDCAWYRGNADSTTHRVGAKAANALGFHDMLGNVWEWTSTWYEADTYAHCVDGADEDAGPPGGLHMVLRGGSWYDAAVRARASGRYRAMWTFEAGHVGLRVAKRIGEG